MAWLELRLRIDPSLAEPCSNLLLEAGALSSAIETADQSAFSDEVLVGEPGTLARFGQQCVVSALFEASAQPDGILRTCAQQLGLDSPPSSEARWIEEQDWVRLTQEQFTPIAVSPRLWIVPSWHRAPDPQALCITLDPGLAFGTGSHPTTRLCLQWLDENIRGGEIVLDYGCGSGILAIAALKLGAASATGIDIDAAALEVACANAEVNQTAAKFFAAETALTGQFDITLANILANPLHVLAPELARVTRPGGAIVLAGLLAEQAAAVCASYAPWFTLREFGRADGWVCLSGTRHSSDAAGTR